jgi:hypothetical protein
MSGLVQREAVLIKQTVFWRKNLERSLGRTGRAAARQLALKIIEGLVFLKLARQRRMEPAGALSGLKSRDGVGALQTVFKRSKTRYHSGIFDLPALPASPRFAAALKKIVRKVLAFRPGKLAPSILGLIYETDPDGIGKGVCFTPDFISEHITRRTLAPLPRRRRPPLVLDPACGAGAFPLKIFEQLAQARGCGASFKLKRRLLLASIHGADIDAFGVELTRLSLLLKLCEGGAEPRTAALPDLSRNIRCGNALVSSPFEGVVPLRWPRAGFDAVIVNPPHMGIGELTRKQGAGQRLYFARNYACARGAYFLHALFLERSLRWLGKGGRLGIILPPAWAAARSEARCRKMILQATRLESIADISPMCVYSKKSVYPHILICEKMPAGDAHFVDVREVFSRADLKPRAAAASLRQSALSPRRGFKIHNE